MEDKLAENPESGSLAVGGSIMFLGLLMGALWAWLRFFRRGGKSQRGGMSRASGQVSNTEYIYKIIRIKLKTLDKFFVFMFQHIL